MWHRDTKILIKHRKKEHQMWHRDQRILTKYGGKVAQNCQNFKYSVGHFPLITQVQFYFQAVLLSLNRL